MKLRWSARSIKDLDQIELYIARDHPETARRWVEQLRSEARRLPDAPRSGRVVPELQREEIRELLVRNYRIVYLVEEQAVVILTVFERHRLLSSYAKMGCDAR